MSEIIRDILCKAPIISRQDFGRVSDIFPYKQPLLFRMLDWLLDICGDICDWFRSGAGRKVVKVTGIVLAVVAVLLVMGWLSRR